MPQGWQHHLGHCCVQQSCCCCCCWRLPSPQLQQQQLLSWKWLQQLHQAVPALSLLLPHLLAPQQGKSPLLPVLPQLHPCLQWVLGQVPLLTQQWQ
jgi:hypothetical protein